VSDIIGQALMSGNDVKNQYGLDYDATANKAAGTSSGTKME